ncbi:Ketosamine-3-kinase [Cystobasidium minutum MCA 4210]|uniref:Ketosamine-3-kinase n=1 Tax=Cystobasidium minutum MCA 4210 TaxID=1397322 RepID=UPI0034CF8BE6|eukprot:jgi/Rhomi1/182353/fgenesh1_pm.1_\
MASAASAAQLIGEAEGLKRMWETSNGLVPKLHTFEKLDNGNKALFISDYINLGSMGGSAMTRLAEKMANELHNPEKQLADVKGFGFPVPTHCGVTEQDNTWEQDWMNFWRDRRLGNILDQIERKRGSSASAVLELGRKVQKDVVPILLSNFEPAPKPVLLHGDLWSGNVATDSATGEPILFDMSSYYGHNEAEFGISQMFSTLPPAFYKKYHSILPRSEPHHEERMKLYELYHHLNHYLMFGGGYGSGAQTIMKNLLSWADTQ